MYNLLIMNLLIVIGDELFYHFIMVHIHVFPQEKSGKNLTIVIPCFYRGLDQWIFFQMFFDATR